MKVVALISGGKDSTFNMMKCVSYGHDIVALANLHPPPSHSDEMDSFTFQTVGHNMIHHYAECMEIPLYTASIMGESKMTSMDYEETIGDETEDLYALLKRVKENVDVEAVSVGAILSDYQRIRVENVYVMQCCQDGHRLDTELLHEMVESGLEAIVIKVASMGLDQRHLGKSLRELQSHLLHMASKFELNPCGEGGEYETFTLDCPLFKKRIVVAASEVVVHSDDAFAPVAYLHLKKVDIVETSNSHPSVLSNVKDSVSKQLLKYPKPDDVMMESISTCHQLPEEYLYPNLPMVRKYGSIFSIHGIFADLDHRSSVAEETESCFQLIKCVYYLEYVLFMGKIGLLSNVSIPFSCIAAIHVFVQNMSVFSEVNTVYANHVGSNPPIRVFVQEREMLHDASLMMDCIGSTTPRDFTMHVQSISEWAPANIGPYSQLVEVDGFLFIAGQIGMFPYNLSLPQHILCLDERVWIEAVSSLQHVSAIMDASKHPDAVIISCICYVTDLRWTTFVKHAWGLIMPNSRKGIEGDVKVVMADGLPKGALVEWHTVASCDHSNNFAVSVCGSGEHALEIGFDEVEAYLRSVDARWEDDVFSVKVFYTGKSDRKQLLLLNLGSMEAFGQRGVWTPEISFVRVGGIESGNDICVSVIGRKSAGSNIQEQY